MPRPRARARVEMPRARTRARIGMPGLSWDVYFAWCVNNVYELA